jgi:hypothetical protein
MSYNRIKSRKDWKFTLIRIEIVLTDVSQIIYSQSITNLGRVIRTLNIYVYFIHLISDKEQWQQQKSIVENGLVEKFLQRVNGSQDGNGNEKFLYRTTEKGLLFLHISQEIEGLMGVRWEHTDTTILTDVMSKL